MSGVVVIANPAAAGGKARRRIPAIASALHRLGVDHRMVVTQNHEHPSRAAREAVASGAEVVAAFGGDGLVNACVQSLIGTETALAVIPAGSGNDFARGLGLDHRRFEPAVSLLAEPTTRRIDAIRIEGPGWQQHYVCVAGTGFDSEVNAYANTIRRLQGTARYVVALVRTLAKYRPGEFTIRVDGQEHQLNAMLVAVANAPSYGGGMKVCPDASLDDGLADLCVVGEMSRSRFLAAFPRVFRGTHVTHPRVTMLRGAKVELSASRPFEVYPDGERGGPLPATFTVVPGALRVVAP